MKATRTITVEELKRLQAEKHVIAFNPRANEVVVDGFRRFNATDYLFQVFMKAKPCTPQSSC